MIPYRFGLVLGVFSLLGSTATVGQRYVARLATPLTARSLSQLGLERVWQTHVAVDASRGSLKFATLHVSRSEWATIFDVKYENGTKSFDERQLDRFGRPVGIERAQFLADVEKRVLETRGIAATIVERRMPSITLYAQTDHGVLQAIDAETGRTKWSYSAGSPRYPSLAPGANDRYVATVNGSTLYVFDLVEEKLAWQKRLGAAPGGGPALTETTIYVPLLNGLVRGFSLADGSNVVQLRSIGRPMVQPLVAGTSLSWPTDRGYLYFVDTTSNEMRFRLETNSEILGSAAYMEPDRAVVTTDDGHAYAIDQFSGEKLWQFSAGDTISSPPMVFGNRAYVVSARGELSAIDGENGRQLWYAPGVKHILAGSNDRVFALGIRGDLMAVDQAAGTILAQVPAGFDIHVPNSISDRIYLGNSRGSLVCLRAAGQEDPILHIALPELVIPEADSDEAATGESPSDESSPSSSEDALPSDRDDPFAVDDADPFSDNGMTDDANAFSDDGGEAPADDAANETDLDDGDADEDDPFSEGPLDEEDPFG